MSYCYDFLIDAAVTLDDLSRFLQHVAELPAAAPDDSGAAVHECAEFSCQVQPPHEQLQPAYRRNLRFSPTWRLRCHLHSSPLQDPHSRLVHVMQLLLQEYDCNFAWLGDGHYPVFRKLHRQIIIQRSATGAGFWVVDLERTAREIGCPFEFRDMPAFG
jgi:hypothetical protein